MDGSSFQLLVSGQAQDWKAARMCNCPASGALRLLWIVLDTIDRGRRLGLTGPMMWAYLFCLYNLLLFYIDVALVVRNDFGANQPARSSRQFICNSLSD